ncbi:TraR/DksA C4-type zinc finger protein [Ectopseudomonas mendocina]|uniref:TraR/DksA C4-type zinc finger protein n=1 Tax=Ectopseudomonas mendocina TaxID=300 RepID=UPI003F0C4080
MAYLADVANDQMQIELDRQLEARQLARPCPVTEECEDCGDPIPFERVQALAKLPCLRCVDCQAYLESKGGDR